MKKVIEINYGRTLKIKGREQYEMDSPMWHEKILLESNGETAEAFQAIADTEYEALKARVDQRADNDYASRKCDLAGLRIREKDGKQYPSVTTITNPEVYTGDPEYGIRGTEIHRICNIFIETGKWEEPSAPLKTLKYKDLKYKEFFEHNKELLDFENHEKNLEVYNEQFLYSGEIDLLCCVAGLWTLVDLKTGSWSWPQLAAYGKSLQEEVEQYAVFDLKKCELAIISPEEITRYWESFLIKRGEFKCRFGL